jgi:hypothetical protein
MEWFFYNQILPNWLPILLGLSVLYSIGSLDNSVNVQLTRTNKDVLYKILIALKSIESDLGEINPLAKSYYYNSLGLGREWAVYKQRKALAKAVFKKAKSEAWDAFKKEMDLITRAYLMPIGWDFSDPAAQKVSADHEKAKSEAKAVFKKAKSEAEDALKKAEAEAWAVRCKSENKQGK